jgi:hypothetical protein
MLRHCSRPATFVDKLGDSTGSFNLLTDFG